MVSCGSGRARTAAAASTSQPSRNCSTSSMAKPTKDDGGRRKRRFEAPKGSKGRERAGGGDFFGSDMEKIMVEVGFEWFLNRGA